MARFGSRYHVGALCNSAQNPIFSINVDVIFARAFSETMDYRSLDRPTALETRSHRRRVVLSTSSVVAIAVLAFTAVVRSRRDVPRSTRLVSHEQDEEFALYPVRGDDGEVSGTQAGLLYWRRVNTPTLKPYVVGEGPSVVVVPGGGFNVVSIEGEGYAIAERFNARGINAFVLKYRVPDRPPRDGAPPHWASLQDVQRAVTLVRANAKAYGIGPVVGVCGFSAGGLLSALASTNDRLYDPVDRADAASCRPDFQILVYPGQLVDASNRTLVSDLKVGPSTPPAFVAHAADDATASFYNSITYFDALAHAGVASSSQLLIEGAGGHGFETNAVCSDVYPQTRYTSIPQICSWMDNAVAWLRDTLHVTT